MARKKLPKLLACLDEDLCTGCEACRSVCPVDCISMLPAAAPPTRHCRVDLDHCIGCALCQQICPWNCIAMTPAHRLIAHAP